MLCSVILQVREKHSPKKASDSGMKKSMGFIAFVGSLEFHKMYYGYRLFVLKAVFRHKKTSIADCVISGLLYHIERISSIQNEAPPAHRLVGLIKH